MVCCDLRFELGRYVTVSVPVNLLTSFSINSSPSLLQFRKRFDIWLGRMLPGNKICLVSPAIISIQIFVPFHRLKRSFNIRLLFLSPQAGTWVCCCDDIFSKQALSFASGQVNYRFYNLFMMKLEIFRRSRKNYEIRKIAPVGFWRVQGDFRYLRHDEVYLFNKYIRDQSLSKLLKRLFFNSPPKK